MDCSSALEKMEKISNIAPTLKREHLICMVLFFLVPFDRLRHPWRRKDTCAACAIPKTPGEEPYVPRREDE
jgi:hypothetical protein